MIGPSIAALLLVGVTKDQIEAAREIDRRDRAREADRARKQRQRANPTPKPDRSLTIAPASDTVVKPTAEILQYRPPGKPVGAIPEDWRPNMTGLMMADQKGLSGARLDLELQRFRDYYLSEGKLKADWNASWRCWLNSPFQEAGNTAKPGLVRATNERDRQNIAWRNALNKLEAAANAGSVPAGGAPLDDAIPF